MPVLSLQWPSTLAGEPTPPAVRHASTLHCFPPIFCLFSFSCDILSPVQPASTRPTTLCYSKDNAPQHGTHPPRKQPTHTQCYTLRPRPKAPKSPPVPSTPRLRQRLRIVIGRSAVFRAAYSFLPILDLHTSLGRTGSHPHDRARVGIQSGDESCSLGPSRERV